MLLFFFYLTSWGQSYQSDLSKLTPQETQWVDSVFQSLNPDQRLGQLFMVRAHSNFGADHVRKVEQLITNHHIGGLCFFQGTPEEQLRLTERYQRRSNLPLLVSMDAEWGLGMRMPASTISFPKQLALGALQDNRLIYEMGAEIARQLKRMGVHVSFSPVVDINNNPENPVIGTRSFGEDRYNVTVKSYMYMKGLQDHGVMACAKHFPGHGDTDVDSHKDLPVIPFERSRLDSVELYPFRALVQHGVGSVMVAHLEVPALDDRQNRPTTLSQSTVSNLLREDLRFDGLIYTDALDMKGVTKYFDPGAVEAEALLAGADVLLLPEDIPAAVRTIRAYVADGKIDQERIDRSIKRILLAKYRLGLFQPRNLPAANLRSDLNQSAAVDLKQQLYEHSLTLVRATPNLLPIGPLDSLNLAALAIGTRQRNTFQNRLADYSSIDLLQTANSLSAAAQEELFQRLRKEDLVIVSFHASGKSFLEPVDVQNSVVNLLTRLQEQTQVLVTVFGSPYALEKLDALDNVLVAYSNEEMAQDVAAQGIFGAIPISGRLPVTASRRSHFNSGVVTQKNFRMGYAAPIRVGLSGDQLERQVDDIVAEAIEEKATPGCVVLVARKGQIVFEKAYGHHTYARKRPVKTDDLYDLASVTKIAASTMAVMDLFERGLVDIHDPIGEYLPQLKATNKGRLVISDILAHRAGLQAWIPFYTKTMSGTRQRPKPSSTYYRPQPGGDFVVEVTDKLYMDIDYVGEIWDQIIQSDLRQPGSYRYSDLGFYLLAELVEDVSGENLADYVQRHFYRPLGLHELTYQPLKQFPRDQVVPTEEDHYFRGQRIQGYVHDMGAAMLGGVSGHAGLFGSAHDLAVLMQLLLQDGAYGDRRYLDQRTVRAFTHRYQTDTRRGLGFDMKQLNEDRSLNMADAASARTFGHQGFTGTCVWVDPKEDLIFVFLSNRTYPSMRNYRLNKLDIRERVHAAVYDAIDPGVGIEELNERLLYSAK